jgi:NADPH:quinone reductase-like Zn-dependent oxidoreductase
MTQTVPQTARQIFSTVTAEDRIELACRNVPVREPADDEVVVRVEAAPINPSDLGGMLSAADSNAFQAGGDADQPLAFAAIPEQAARFVAARVGIAVSVGNEGAGTVVKAGASPEAQALLGKTVALIGGGCYADYRIAKAAAVFALPDGVTAEEGASAFVNPMTALGMIGTMRLDGYKGLVHTAAASNLGQMLVKLCAAEGVPLVNIVRSEEQVALLKGLGAEHVVNSTAPDFFAELTAAIAATDAYLAFDAIGGGKLAGQILTCMEAAVPKGTTFSPYGSTQMKQVYLYGGLSQAPTEFGRSFGMKWGIGGWLVGYFLERVGMEETIRLRARVGRDIRTIFASQYSHRISLTDVVDPAMIATYNRRATGEKYLVTPHG